MIFTILVPTYNNLKYLKLFCESIKNNSNYDHQLVFHVNNGSDGSYDYIYNNRYQFTYSKKNIGLCSSIKEASPFTRSGSTPNCSVITSFTLAGISLDIIYLRLITYIGHHLHQWSDQ